MGRREGDDGLQLGVAKVWRGKGAIHDSRNRWKKNINCQSLFESLESKLEDYSKIGFNNFES